MLKSTRKATVNGDLQTQCKLAVQILFGCQSAASDILQVREWLLSEAEALGSGTSNLCSRAPGLPVPRSRPELGSD